MGDYRVRAAVVRAIASPVVGRSHTVCPRSWGYFHATMTISRPDARLREIRSPCPELVPDESPVLVMPETLAKRSDNSRPR